MLLFVAVVAVVVDAVVVDVAVVVAVIIVVVIIFDVVIIQSLRAFRRAVLFRLFAWWLVGLSSLRLSVCSFDRGIFLRTVRELVLGASWASFWELGGSPGHHFGVCGLLLGSILGVWGCLGLHFWGSGTPLVPLGLLGGPPWPPKVPKAKFSHFFPSHFGLILAPFWR